MRGEGEVELDQLWLGGRGEGIASGRKEAGGSGNWVRERRKRFIAFRRDLRRIPVSRWRKGTLSILGRVEIGRRRMSRMRRTCENNKKTLKKRDHLS